MSELTDRYDAVKIRVEEAAKRAGRSSDDITLIAVSKTRPASEIQELYDHGVRHFGENKVQELAAKYEELPKDIHWHLIGHLQRNKVKYIIDKAELIHSVDSLRLAEQISLQAVKEGKTADILLEVNVAQEESKFGLTLSETAKMAEDIAALDNIRIKGLMTIAPFVEISEENREVFAGLKQLSVDIMRKNIDNVSMSVLSMGMTGDFETAIEEGATMVRVGTAIFGARDYSI